MYMAIMQEKHSQRKHYSRYHHPPEWRALSSPWHCGLFPNHHFLLSIGPSSENFDFHTHCHTIILDFVQYIMLMVDSLCGNRIWLTLNEKF